MVIVWPSLAPVSPLLRSRSGGPQPLLYDVHGKSLTYALPVGGGRRCARPVPAGRDAIDDRAVRRHAGRDRARGLGLLLAPQVLEDVRRRLAERGGARARGHRGRRVALVEQRDGGVAVGQRL